MIVVIGMVISIMTQDKNMEKEINLTQTIDAEVWAKEWLRIIEKNPSIPMDAGCMIGWFANAIMAGFDEANRRNEKVLKSVNESVQLLQQAIEK